MSKQPKCSSYISVLMLVIALAGCSRSPAMREAKAIARGQQLLAQKDYAKAILEFRAAAQLVHTDAEPYYQLALALLASGDDRQGYQALRKAVQLNPKHRGAQAALAELLATKGSQRLLGDAERAAKEALALSPDDVDALHSLALIELRSGRRAAAEEYLDQAVSKFPANLKAAVGLAKVRMMAGDIQGAESVLKSAAQNAPNSAETLVALGNFYAALRRFPEAIRQLEAATKMKPDDPVALLSLAEAAYTSGQTDRAVAILRQLSLSSDLTVQPLYGRFLLETGDRNGALAEFERLARDHPKDRDARGRLARMYVLLGRTADAEAIFNGALQKNPKDSDALIERSAVHVAQRKYSEAQDDLKQALRYQPRSAEAHFLLSRIHRARGFALGERQELTDSLEINPNSLPARLALAANLSQKSPQDALAVLEKAPKSQLRTLTLIVQRNDCLYKLGKNEELRQSLDAALAQTRAPALLMQDGLLKFRLKKYDAALASFREALESVPQNSQALNMVGQCYLAQGRSREALEAVRAHASQYPKAAAVQQLLGKWLQDQGQLSQARLAFEAAKAADPSFLNPAIALAMLDAAEGHFDAARTELTRIVTMKPEDANARFILANVEDETGNPSKATAHYKLLVDHEPDNALFLNGLAYSLASDPKRVDEALSYAQKAKELSPKDPYISDTLGWVLYQKGIYRSALVQLEAAFADRGSMDPKNVARLQYHLAMAYFRSENPIQGRRALNNARRIAPALPEAAMAQELENRSPR